MGCVCQISPSVRADGHRLRRRHVPRTLVRRSLQSECRPLDTIHLVYSLRYSPIKQTFNYGIKVVSLLGFCTSILLGDILSEDDEMCKAGILSRRDQLFKAMWRLRPVIKLESLIIGPDHAFFDFITLPYPAYCCVGQILALSRNEE